MNPPPSRAPSCSRERTGEWLRSARLGWDKLITVQQWLSEHVRGIPSAAEGERPKPRRTQADEGAAQSSRIKGRTPEAHIAR
ncbi:hypothetical protein Scel_00290 [Streptomyces cellostaticus]|nr:hypothetical protein Scel_00290 [Streptomyces cellostaticus]